MGAPRWRRAAWGLLSVATLSAQSTSSTTADLRGRIQGIEVSDPLELRLWSKASGSRWVTSPDPQGTFVFHLLPPDTYALEVWGAGSRRMSLPELRLHAGTTHELSLSPPPQAQVSVEDTLVAEGEARTQAAWVVDSQQLRALPINRRNFTDLSLVTPLAVASRGPSSAGAPDSGLSFAGAGPRQNNFMVDGLDNNDLGNGNTRLLMSQDAILEFQVITNGYTAEFGRATGAVVNAVTRSGGNQAEGSFFHYLRPGGLDAHSPLGQGSTDFQMQQYGASISGPVLKDRLFYYVSVERMERTEDHPLSVDATVLAAVQSAGFNLDTASTKSTAGSLSLLARLDFLNSPESRWGLRLLHSGQRSDDFIPWGGLKARSTGGRQDLRDTALSLTHQWVPDSRLVRESRLMYTTRSSEVRALDEDQSVQVDLQGVASFGTQRLSPQSTRTGYLQFADTTTWVLGEHTLKGGLDWLNTHNQGSVENNYAGYYLFQAVQPYFATSLAAFQGGYPVAYFQAFGNPYTHFSTDYQSAFLQDEWRPRAELLLRFGLRYDRERLPSFADTADYQALATSSNARLPDGSVSYAQLFNTQRDWTSARWSPRLSLSWQATPSLRIFGGYGSFMGQTNLSPIFGMRTTNGAQGYGVVLTALDTNPLTSQIGTSPATAWAQPGHRFASDPGVFPISLVIPGTHQAPLSRQQNLGAEWKPRPELTLTLDLLHSKGTHLMNMRDVNAYVPYNGWYRRVDSRYSSIFRVDDSGGSRYLAQSLTADWRPSTRARLQVSYCHSKAEDNTSDWTGALSPQNTFDPSTEWGPSSQDQRHRIQVNAVLNSGDGGAPWLQHWTLGALVAVGSGRPYSQLAGTDLNSNGDGSSDRPAGVGRNSETLPWTHRVDLRIARGFALAQMRGEACLDIFNLFNRANVKEVQNTLNASTPSYGTPTEFEAMRQVQLGLRLNY